MADFNKIVGRPSGYAAAVEPERKPASGSGPYAAIACCILARRRAVQLGQANGRSIRDAEAAGDQAFLGAMPPLSSYDNICDFIACVAHAIVTGVLGQKDAIPLLEAAKAALCDLRELPGAA